MEKGDRICWTGPFLILNGGRTTLQYMRYALKKKEARGRYRTVVMDLVSLLERDTMRTFVGIFRAIM